MKLGKHWDLTGGIRWDRFDTDYSQTVAPASAFNRVDEMPSWRAALVYKPVSIGSIYFDAGTSFNPSAESLSLSASTASLPPEKNRTYEFGTNGTSRTAGCLFARPSSRPIKLNAREPDPTNSLLNVLAGNQRVNGAQIEVRAHLSSRWDMLGSYANLDGRWSARTTTRPPSARNSPTCRANTFNFWSTYRLPWHWQTGVGGNYVSSRTASSTVPLDPTTGLVKEVPGYWVFNAMAEASLDRASGSPSQHQKHCEPLLLR